MSSADVERWSRNASTRRAAFVFVAVGPRQLMVLASMLAAMRMLALTRPRYPSVALLGASYLPDPWVHTALSRMGAMALPALPVGN